MYRIITQLHNIRIVDDAFAVVEMNGAFWFFKDGIGLKFEQQKKFQMEASHNFLHTKSIHQSNNEFFNNKILTVICLSTSVEYSDLVGKN